jgi:cobalt transporter subunit CbtA
MIQRMLASALIAGIAAGLLAALLHFAFVQSLILMGEQYETGAIVHFGTEGAGVPEHSRDEITAGADAIGHADDGHDHAAEGSSSSFQRNALTVVFMVALYSAYGLLLVAGFGIAEAFGRKIGPTEGLLWGLAGFVAFQLAPAMGLAPELPGTLAAEMPLRQIWWWMTLACTGTGLALLGYGRKWLAYGLAVALLAAPHIFGAPELDGFSGTAPPELASMFAARVLGAALIVWACLGWCAGAIWAREGQRAGA